MSGLLKMIFSPILSLIIITLGNGYFNTFVTLRISDFSEAPLLAGLIYSAYYTGMMVGSFYMEPLIKRIGHIRAFTLFASLTSCMVLIQGVIFSIFTWLLFRFLSGMAFAGFFIVIESWLLLISSPTTRGKALSIYMIALYSAQGCGQFMLNVFRIDGIGAFVFTAILSSLSIIPVCLMKTNYPVITESEKANAFQLLKKVPVGFFGCFLSGFILSSFYALGPIYCKEQGMNLMQISQIMGCTILGSLLIQSPLGYLSDIIERRKVILLTAVGLLSSCGLILLSNFYPFYILVALFTIYGGFAFTLYPLSIAYCCDYVTSAGITAVAASCLIIYGIGCIISPLLAPLFVQALGPNGLIIYLCIISTILILLSIARKTQKNPSAQELIQVENEIPPVTPESSFPIETPLIDKENKEE